MNVNTFIPYRLEEENVTQIQNEFFQIIHQLDNVKDIDIIPTLFHQLLKVIKHHLFLVHVLPKNELEKILLFLQNQQSRYFIIKILIHFTYERDDFLDILDNLDFYHLLGQILISQLENSDGKGIESTLTLIGNIVISLSQNKNLNLFLESDLLHLLISFKNSSSLLEPKYFKLLSIFLSTFPLQFKNIHVKIIQYFLSLINQRIQLENFSDQNVALAKCQKKALSGIFNFYCEPHMLWLNQLFLEKKIFGIALYYFDLLVKLKNISSIPKILIDSIAKCSYYLLLLISNVIDSSSDISGRLEESIPYEIILSLFLVSNDKIQIAICQFLISCCQNIASFPLISILTYLNPSFTLLFKNGSFQLKTQLISLYFQLIYKCQNELFPEFVNVDFLTAIATMVDSNEISLKLNIYHLFGYILIVSNNPHHEAIFEIVNEEDFYSCLQEDIDSENNEVASYACELSRIIDTLNSQN